MLSNTILSAEIIVM
jgi:hypothetical protein